jgi:peroxiredoxin (alkyl hydroperoxide reductase subunit C)
MVIGASCDTNEVHFLLNTAKTMAELKVLPTLADTNRNLSNILGILDIDSTEYRRD